LDVGFLKLYKYIYALKKGSLTVLSERMTSFNKGLFNIREVALFNIREVAKVSSSSRESRNLARVIAGFAKAEVTSE